MAPRRGKKISKIKKKFTKLQLLQQEVNYFHGLSVFLVLLMAIIFFTFSFLFAGMYKETKLIRENYEDTHNRLVDVLEEDVVPEVLEEEGVLDGHIGSSNTDNKWQEFEKYGVETIFPNSWTYIDKPFIEQMHFFSDGVVRDLETREQGDFYISFQKSDRYAGEYEGDELVNIISMDGRTNLVGRKYELVNDKAQLDVVVVPVNGKYVELIFVRYNRVGEEVLSDDVIDFILTNIRIACNSCS